MAKIKYFADLNGETIELTSLHSLDNAKFAAAFPGIIGKRSDSFSKWVGFRPGTREVLPVTRSIEYKAFPSKHECDARCINATGKIMRCECSCGGKNHGKGAFSCVMVQS
jgi:hypothetical protein